MDYIGNKCPVCNKYFHADDDVVVCPECGTPHHRECYEQTGHCFNEEKHASGYDYQTDDESVKDQPKRCPSCGKENDTNSFFCNQCGAPLTPDQNANRSQAPPSGMPFGAGGGQPGAGFNAPFADPMGGVASDTDFGDGVTAGETAKYVKQNTPYFMRVFSNIKNFNKTKFNFAAALFPGGYMLYRKMYKLGTLFTILHFALEIFEKYLYICLTVQMTGTQTGSSYLESLTSYLNLSVSDVSLMYLYYLIYGAIIAIRIVVGICFNRMYFKHCKAQIIRIKTEAKENENPETILQTKGGVNTPLFISLLVTYGIIYSLPTIFSYFFL